MNVSPVPLLRRLTIALLVGAVTAPLFASKEHPVIGLTMDSFDIPRWQRDRDTFVAAVRKQGGVVLVQSANSDDQVQIQNMKSFTDRHVDAIVVVAHNGAALGDAVKAAAAAHIPVISYDRLIPNADISCYIGFDNRKVGELQAQYIADRLPAGRKARIVRLLGAATDPNATDFKLGQDKVLDPLIKAGRVEIVYEDWVANWDADVARQVMTKALAKAGSPIDAVLASNDVLAGAAVDVLTAAHVTVPIITGQDADRSACARIKEGTQSMTVFKPVSKLAELAAQVAIGYARGEPPAANATTNNGAKVVPTFMNEVVSVDKNNLGTILVEAGIIK